MKFALHLEESQVPEWKEEYFPFRALKSKLETIGDSFQRGTSGESNKAALIASDRSSSAPCDTLDPNQDDLPNWRSLVESEAMRVSVFVGEGVQSLEEHLQELRVLARQCSPEDTAPGDGAGIEMTSSSLKADAEAAYDPTLKPHVLDAVGRAAQLLVKLRCFAEVNHAALYKIFKRYDKKLGTKEGLTVHFPRLTEATDLGNMARFGIIDRDLREVCLLTSGSVGLGGLDANTNVARLVAGVGSNGDSGTPQLPSGERRLWFFLGSSSALLFSITALIVLPPIDPETYNVSALMTPFPVFRVLGAVVLCHWGIGWVMRTCQASGINYNFMLGIDPRYKTRPQFFFGRGAALTTVWVFTFGMYLWDYKYSIFPRDTLPLYKYPAIVLVATLVAAAVPSRQCGSGQKAGVLRSLGRTMLAPLFQVSFFDNIVGNVLSSLTKPLQEIPTSACYFLDEHPKTPESVAKFESKADECPAAVHTYLLPIIAALPIFFRTMQCLRRYYDTGQSKQMWNFGKYLASLLVVLVSSTQLKKYTILLVFVSLFATCCSATWDIHMDWGVSRECWKAMTGHKPYRERRCWSTATRGSPKNFERGTTPGSVFSQRSDATEGTVCHSFGGVTHLEEETKQRVFQPKTYLACSIFDIVGRLTWVLTLMPMEFITKDMVFREVFRSVIIAIEITRRCMWSVIRIENEQVNNASGFRALLWVPRKLTKESVDLTAIDTCHKSLSFLYVAGPQREGATDGTQSSFVRQVSPFVRQVSPFGQAKAFERVDRPRGTSSISNSFSF